MAKSKVGRPPFKITEQIVKQVEALAAQGLTLDQIAATIGCHPATLYKKKKQLAEFNEAIKRGQHKGVATISNALFNKAKKGDNTAMIFYLKNRDPKNWADVQNHNVTIPVTKADESEW